MSLFERLRRAAQGEVGEDVPLAARTSVRVGGSARFVVRPRDPDCLVAALGELSNAGLGWFSLGGGANTIVGDRGVSGAVVRLSGDFVVEEIEEGGDHVVMTLGAGAPIARFGSLAKEQRCAGVAWAAGIPGTVGGMVAMNAGTQTGCAGDHLRAVEVATPDGLRWIDAQALKLGYRHCELPPGAVLTRARLHVRRGTDVELLEQEKIAKADVARRRQTQPLTQPNSGSVFVNPPGDYAGRLIESVGLKGKSEGGAQISEKHANFIVNAGNATAADVVALIALARKVVLDRHGVALQPEVRLVGDFAPPLPAELVPHHLVPTHLGRSTAIPELDPTKSSFLRVQA